MPIDFLNDQPPVTSTTGGIEFLPENQGGIEFIPQGNQPEFEGILDDLGKSASNAFEFLKTTPAFLELFTANLQRNMYELASTVGIEKHASLEWMVNARAIEAIAIIQESQRNMQPTQPLLEAIEEGDPSKIAAGVGGAIINTGRSVATAMATLGMSAFAEPIAQSYSDALLTKAEEEGTSPAMMFIADEDEELIPLLTGTVQGVLEKVGIDKITKGMLKRAPAGFWKKMLDVIGTGGTEAGTEYLQGTVDLVNQRVAEGVHVGDAIDLSIRDAATLNRGLVEQGLQGFFGGAGVKGGSFLGQAMRKPSVVDVVESDKAIEEALSTENANLDAEIDNELSRQAINIADVTEGQATERRVGETARQADNIQERIDAIEINDDTRSNVESATQTLQAVRELEASQSTEISSDQRSSIEQALTSLQRTPRFKTISRQIESLFERVTNVETTQRQAAVEVATEQALEQIEAPSLKVRQKRDTQANQGLRISDMVRDFKNSGFVKKSTLKLLVNDFNLQTKESNQISNKEFNEAYRQFNQEETQRRKEISDIVTPIRDEVKKLNLPASLRGVTKELSAMLKQGNISNEALKQLKDISKGKLTLSKARDINSIITSNSNRVSAERQSNIDTQSRVTEARIQNILRESKRMIEGIALQDDVKAGKERINVQGMEPAKQQAVQEFLDIDTSDMKPNEIKEYLKGLDHINELGEVSAEVVKFTTTARKNAKLKQLQESGLKGELRDLNSSLARHLNASQIATNMAKFVRENANKLMDVFYSDLIGHEATAQKESSKLSQRMQKIAKKYNLKNHNQYRIQLYSQMITTDVPITDPQFNQQVDENIAFIEQSLIDKLEAAQRIPYSRFTKKQVNKEIAAFEEVVSQYKDKGIDGVLTEGEQALRDEFQTYLRERKPFVKTMTESFYDQPFVEHYNYSPTSALGDINKTYGADRTEDTPIATVLDESNLDVVGKVVSPRARFTRDRVQDAKGTYYDNNFSSVAARYSKEVEFDLRAANEVRVVSELIEDPATAEEIGNQNMRVLKRAIKSNIKRSRGIRQDYGALVNLIEKYKNNAMVASMANFGQFFKQFLATAPATMMYSPSGFGKALQTFAMGKAGDISLDDWFQQHGKGIQARDILFEKFEENEYAKEGNVKLTQKFETLTTATLKSADKMAAKLTFLAAFFEAGGDLDNPQREHIIAAERKTTMLQNVNNASFAPEALYPDTKSKRLLVSMLWTFKSFALNQMLNTYGSLQNIGNKEAQSLLAANVANVFMFQMMSVIASEAYLEAAGLVKGLLGDEFEEEEEEELDVTTRKIFVRGMYDLFFGGVPHAIDEFASTFIEKKIVKPWIESDGENYNPKVDPSLYVEWTAIDGTAAALGGYGRMFSDTYDLLDDLSDAAIATINDENENLEEAEVKLVRDAILGVLTYSKLIPFRGDAKSIGSKYFSKEIRERFGEQSKRNTQGTPYIPSVPPVQSMPINPSGSVYAPPPPPPG